MIKMSRIKIPGINSKVTELWEVAGEYDVVIDGFERMR